MINKTIAVLPIVNMCSNKENEYLCDGITEEIQNTLSKINGLVVTARTSSFYFKDQKYDIEKIGKQLNVQAILKGSMQVVKNNIKINVQLINTDDYYMIWSESFNCIFDEIFNLQSKLSQNVAEKIREFFGHIELNEKKSSSKHEKFSAYNLYFKAKFHLNKTNFESTKIAIELFKKVIETEPNYALAYSGLSKAYSFLGIIGKLSPQEVYLNSKKYAEQGIKIDKKSSDNYLALAYISFFFEWDIKTTLNLIYKALKVSYGTADTHWFYGMVLSTINKKEEALKEAEIALRLDPLSVYCNHFCGVVYISFGEYEKAINNFNHAISLDPTYSISYLMKAYALTYSNKTDEAITLFQNIPLGNGKTYTEHGGLGYTYAKAGNTKKAEYYLQLLNETKESFSPMEIENSKMIIYLALNKFNEASQIFDNQFEKRSPALLASKFDTAFKPIIGLPCYKKFDNIIANGDATIQPQYLRYKTSSLNSEEGKKMNNLLLEYMDNQKPYLDPELSLNCLSKQLGVNSNYLSQVINEYQKVNFFSFINNYRIEHLVESWRNPKNKGFTLLSLALDAGYNSKTAFNTSFKKIKGETPTKYLKSL